MKKSVAWVFALLAVFMVSSAADAASAAKRKRRKRPGTSSPESAPAESSKPSTSGSSSSSSSSSAAGGKSLDAQISEVQANIRKYRRATSKAVDAANLTGTMIFIPGGNASGKKVDYSSKHSGKTIRGQVKATGSGPKAAATITASRAK